MEWEIEGFVAAYREVFRNSYPTGTSDEAYAAIVNQHHYERLTGLIDDAQKKGARPQRAPISSLLIGIAVGVLSGVVVGVVAGLTVMACKHPKSYEKLYGALLIILLGALAGGTFWDLRNGVSYSRFVVIAVIIYFSFLRALPLFLARDKPVKGGDD